MCFAHSRNDRGERQDLVAHLRQVSDLTARYAAPLGAAELGRFLGLWHDVGKFDPAFQRYLLASEADPRYRQRVDHKAAGACLAFEQQAILALLLRGQEADPCAPGAVASGLRAG